MHLRLRYIIATTAIAVFTVVLTDGMELHWRIAFIVGAIFLYVALFITSAARRLSKAVRTNGSEVDYFDIDKSELNEEFLTSIATLERCGFVLPDRILRPVGATFKSRSTMVLMFSQNRDVVACASDQCGHLSISFWSVFDVDCDNDGSLWTLDTTAYDTADRYELWQCLPKLTVPVLHETHLASVTQMTERGVGFRAMDVEGCVALLKACSTRKHAKIMQAPFTSSVKLMTQWMFGWSRYRGRIETQMAGRATLERILERAHLVPNV